MKYAVKQIANILNIDEHSLFIYAHGWKYHEYGSVRDDFILYFNLDIVPDYVKEFIEHIEQQTGGAP